MFGKEFIQPNERGWDRTLPSEAISVNGIYLDNEIYGFKTLSVQGRELLAHEVTTESFVGADGSVITQTRYPEREITVNYRLEVSEREYFRDSFNKLNRILSGPNKVLRFNDEPEYFFRGTLSSVDQVPTGSNSITSSFTFLCNDPFKYLNLQTATGRQPNISFKNSDSPYLILPTIIEVDVESSSEFLMLMNSHNVTKSKQIRLSGVNFNVGDRVVFDFNKFTITKNGEDIIRALDITSDFEDFYIGEGPIIAAVPGGNLTIHYREVEL